MVRRLAQAGLALCLALSLCLSVWTALDIARNPLVRPMVERSRDQIVAATDRMMAREATAERVSFLLRQRLEQDPRNWIAIDALEAVATDRGLALPPDLLAARAAAWEADSSLWTQAVDCAACAYDPAACSLSNVLVCQVPVALTPIGDLAGLARAGTAYLAGSDVDEVDLALSVIGFAATAVVLASGGASATVKIGAATARVARRMDLLSPGLVAVGTRAAREGIDWAALPAVRTADDVVQLLRMDALAPAIAISADLGRMERAAGLPETLHLLRYIEDATDARRMANATEALGTRVLGRIEVLGKARLLRATLHWSDLAWQTLASILALGMTLAAFIGNIVQNAALRGLRRAARPPSPRRSRSGSSRPRH